MKSEEKPELSSAVRHSPEGHIEVRSVDQPAEQRNWGKSAREKRQGADQQRVSGAKEVTGIEDTAETKGASIPAEPAGWRNENEARRERMRAKSKVEGRVLMGFFHGPTSAVLSMLCCGGPTVIAAGGGGHSETVIPLAVSSEDKLLCVFAGDGRENSDFKAS
ncbi:hypothetical protein NQZ68_017575, partial [Dissostichus eleginoides]